ncbi:ABC transporter substrate-binding protein [Paenibacillus sp. IB182496]|uniref:ABC transporter substrate-binding protein n=1 Tax=Paenibacillus sabuli TaxID=2772509 RepID=A0A927BVK0_9BACL|nr:ABC transporter substrate-binding protein [Paenibacillus sabuli]MBD2846530.1 ABC transporter substrate-binding protein [Paenibacillus sabuli]
MRWSCAIRRNGVNETTTEADHQQENNDALEADGASATRVVSTINGEVEIPAEPQRIAATYYAGELAALGIRPAGTVTRLLPEQSPHLAGYTDDALDLGQFPPNMEAMVELAPDLIIAADFDELDYEQLSKIAPTVILPWTTDDVWGKLRTVAGILGKEAEAEVYIEAYETHAAEARAAIEGVIQEGETVSVIRFVGKGGVRGYAGRDVGHAFHHGLQLDMPPAMEALVEEDPNLTSTGNLSLEESLTYAGGDWLFILVTDKESDQAYQQAQELWSNLPAVQNQRVHLLPADVWFTYDPISMNHTLDEAVRLLVGGDEQG